AAGNGAVANSSSARTEFSLAPISTGPNNGNLRVYVGDASGSTADFYTVGNANVTAATLVGGNNGGWTKLSDSTNGTPGFAPINTRLRQLRSTPTSSSSLTTAAFGG